MTECRVQGSGFRDECRATCGVRRVTDIVDIPLLAHKGCMFPIARTVIQRPVGGICREHALEEPGTIMQRPEDDQKAK